MPKKKKKNNNKSKKIKTKTKDDYMERDGVGVELDLGGFRSSANRCKSCCCVAAAAAAAETWRSSAKCEPFLLRKLAPRTRTDVTGRQAAHVREGEGSDEKGNFVWAVGPPT